MFNYMKFNKKLTAVVVCLVALAMLPLLYNNTVQWMLRKRNKIESSSANASIIALLGISDSKCIDQVYLIKNRKLWIIMRLSSSELKLVVNKIVTHNNMESSRSSKLAASNYERTLFLLGDSAASRLELEIKNCEVLDAYSAGRSAESFATDCSRSLSVYRPHNQNEKHIVIFSQLCGN